MGEIDDLYKAEVEDMDSAFLEELKTSSDRKKSFDNYRKNLRKSIEKFEKSYIDFNSSEKKRILKMKKKIEKYPEFKHLKVSHFEFEFGFWERIFMRLDIFWFNVLRKFNIFRSRVFPNWLVYGWFRVWKFSSSVWNDFTRLIEKFSNNSKKFFEKKWKWFVEEIKNGVLVLKTLFSKMLFWKKKEANGEEKGKDTEKNSKDEKKEEG